MLLHALIKCGFGLLARLILAVIHTVVLTIEWAIPVMSGYV